MVKPREDMNLRRKTERDDPFLNSNSPDIARFSVLLEQRKQRDSQVINMHKTRYEEANVMLKKVQEDFNLAKDKIVNLQSQLQRIKFEHESEKLKLSSENQLLLEKLRNDNEVLKGSSEQKIAILEKDFQNMCTKAESLTKKVIEQEAELNKKEVAIKLKSQSRVNQMIQTNFENEAKSAIIQTDESCVKNVKKAGVESYLDKVVSNLIFDVLANINASKNADKIFAHQNRKIEKLAALFATEGYHSLNEAVSTLYMNENQATRVHDEQRISRTNDYEAFRKCYDILQENSDVNLRNAAMICVAQDIQPFLVLVDTGVTCKIIFYF